MLYAILGYGAFCIGFAALNAYWIRKDKRILHGLNGLAHALIIGFCGYTIDWFIVIPMLFQGRLMFDVALNLFRGKEFDYVPENPKSIIDKIEKKVFGEDGVFPKVIYLNVFAVSLLLMKAIQ